MILVPTTATAAPTRATCKAGELMVADGCVSRAAAARKVDGITRATMSSLGLKATILRIDTGRRPLLTKAFGESMAGPRRARTCTSGSARWPSRT